MKWKEWLIFGVGVSLAVRQGANVVRLYRAGDVLKEAQAGLEKAKQEQAELQKRLVWVQSPEFLEQEAREKLGLGKPGEVMLILPDQSVNPKSEILNPKQNTPNWKKWWEAYVATAGVGPAIPGL